MKTENLTFCIESIQKVGSDEERFTASFSTLGSSGYEEHKTLNQVISEIQNELIDTIIINPIRVTGKSLGILLNVLSQRDYQLKKDESKQIQSDIILIDAMLDNS
ncbi:MAG: hypothetical protein L0H55_16480, partial [Candidatus Nitrosocosmicus sp.]|nr:hypothetical protein [Candidatus Nitrosocosmicus sp.]